MWGVHDLRVIGSTHWRCVLWKNSLRVAKLKKQQTHRDKTLRVVKGESRLGVPRVWPWEMEALDHQREQY